MTKRVVDIDDDLLQFVKDWLGTKTIKETVNQALREVARQPDRLEMVKHWLTDPGRDTRQLEVLEKAYRQNVDTWLIRARSSGIASGP